MKWEEVKLNGLFEVKHGFAFKSEFFSENGKYAVTTPGHFFEAGGFRQREGKEKYYKGEFPPQYLLSKGDLIIAMTEQGEGLLGSTAIIPEDEKYLHNQRLGLVINEDKERIWKKFLYYLLNTYEHRATIAASATGTKVKHTSPSRILDLTVKLPPLPTQQKIASILSAYDDLIENNLKRIKLLEEAAQHLYREWFVRFRFPGHETVKMVEGLPEGWEKVNLYDFAKLQMGYPFKAEDFNEDKIGTPVVRIRDIPNHWTNTYSRSDTSEDYFVEKNDIVVGMDGFFYTDVWGGQRSYLVQRVCRIRPNDERLNGYLLEAIKEPIKYFEKTITGATVSHLGAKHLKQIEIIKPDEKFVPELEIFNHLHRQRVVLLNHNHRLKTARDLLLPRLMSGVLEV